MSFSIANARIPKSSPFFGYTEILSQALFKPTVGALVYYFRYMRRLSEEYEAEL